MRASFLDPQGPLLARSWPYLTLLVAWLVGLEGVGSSAAANALTLGAVIVFFVLRTVHWRQTRPRDVALSLGPGYVEVKGAGLRNQRIAAKSVKGATTATTSRGVLLTLNHAGRSQSLTLEVANEGDADRLRRALGIGHGGFGVLSWNTATDSSQKIGTVGNAGIVAFALLFFWTLRSSPATGAFGVVFGLAMLLAPFLIPFALVGLFAKSRLPTIVMDASGVRLATTQGWFGAPYAAIRDVRREGRRLTFEIGEPFRTVTVLAGHPWLGAGITDAEFRGLRAQLLSAAARARGLGRPKEDASSRLEMLRRQNEAPRDWLVRLDTTGQMLASPAGYRGLSVDADDLWTTLEDPEADPELRTAALRVLRHLGTPDARTRIAEAIASVHDDREGRKLRVATTDDVDAASQELAVLDIEDARREMFVRS